VRPARGPDAAVARWIRRRLAAAPPRAKSLVVTVWGDALAPHGSAVWLSGLIRLLAPLGLNERLVRTSVYRLAREGWLASRSEGRRSVYRLTPSGSRRFEDAYRRIYAPPSGRWDGSWELIFAPPGRLSSPDRRELERQLSWAGFGAPGAGLFVRPRLGARPGVPAIPEGSRLAKQLIVVSGREPSARNARPLRAWVPLCWDVDAVAREYRRFMARYAPVLRIFSSRRAADPEQCFVVRTLLIHDFRRVILHDPQLPEELLPRGWPAGNAYRLCGEFYRLTHRLAERHLSRTFAEEGQRLPSAARYFYRRFGGL